MKTTIKKLGALGAITMVCACSWGQTNVKDEKEEKTTIYSNTSIIGKDTEGNDIKDKYVGIGTTTPNFKLEVKKKANMSTAWMPNLLLNNGWGGIGSEGLRIRSGKEGVNFDIFSFDHEIANDTYLGFKVWKSDVSSNFDINAQMVLTQNGYVGIGTTTPGCKLDVCGTIRAKEVKVEEFSCSNGSFDGTLAANNITLKANGNTADFVFEDNYRLKDLDEVEAFIKTNKHLPDVPSAAQMEEQGVNLAEMNKLLLQKVEELTLHLIEKDKEVGRLEDRLAKIEGMLLKGNSK